MPQASIHLLNAFLSAIGAFCFSMAVILSPGIAKAEDELISSIELLEDPTGAQSIHSVQNAQFRPVGTTLIEGYTKSVYWLRLRIRPSRITDRVTLMIRPPTFDDVSLYTSDDQLAGAWSVQRIGARHPVRSEEWASSLRGFSLSPARGGTTYYLRLSTSGTFIAHLSARQQSEAYEYGLKIDMLQIVYLSFMLMLLLWSLRMGLLTREKLFWLFAGLQSAWIIHNLFAFGYLLLFFPFDDHGPYFLVYRTFVIVVTALSIRFHKAVLIRFAPPQIAIRLLDLGLLLAAAAFVVFWVYDRTLGLKLNSLVILGLPLAFLANACGARRNASPGLGIMRLTYLALSLSLVTWVLQLVGVSGANTQALYGTMIHGTATGLLMFAILHLHGQNLIESAQRAQAAMEALTARQMIVAENNAILRQFNDTLTHETRNAMAVINMSMSAATFGERQRARIVAALRDLAKVVDHFSQTAKLDRGEHGVRRQRCDLAEILRQTCAMDLPSGRIALTCPPQAVIESDPVILQVVFSNLLDNALKYSAVGSEIAISLKLNQPQVITIHIDNDPGPFGLPDENRLFQKYYRSVHASARIGSGLGLYIVRGLMRSLGGEVDYRGENGLVRFSVHVPC